MQSIPSPLQARFIEHLKHDTVPASTHSFYLKWLRYYLDFCKKYELPHGQGSSLAPFLRKLQDKRQSAGQQEQARHAILLYYELLRPQAVHRPPCTPSPQPERTSGDLHPGIMPSANSASRQVSDPTGSRSDTLVPVAPRGTYASQPQPRPLAQGFSWKDEYVRLKEEIKLRHYSPKTLGIYTHWVRQYQTFVRSQDPKSLSTEHVKRFLTFLAVDRKVSASTQNLAFNALLFLGLRQKMVIR
jgi:hypothetical protein